MGIKIRLVVLSVYTKTSRLLVGVGVLLMGRLNRREMKLDDQE